MADVISNSRLVEIKGVFRTVSQRPQLLFFRQGSDVLDSLVAELGRHCNLTVADSLSDSLHAVQAGCADAVCVGTSSLSPAGLLLEAGGLLALMPDGLVVLDAEGVIRWANSRAGAMFANEDPPAEIIGQSFQTVLGTDSKIVGPDFSPVNTALGSGERSRTTIHRGEKQFLEATFTPIRELHSEFPSLVLAVIRDISHETLQQHKLNAIIQAGIDLGDLQPDDVIDLSVGDRIELLKSKLLHYTQDLLEFNTVEIRIVERGTGRLKPLLALGMKADAEARELFALADNNGVTGFVAATGRSYLCEDTSKDPLYLEGAEGAKSSLTVPLVLHDQVLGTFNVESPRIGAFSEKDLQYLELFCREVAIALNTLDLLLVEKEVALVENTKRVLCEVADPVDEILNDASWILEKFSNEPGVQERLRRILEHTQEIRQQILNAGESTNSSASRGIIQIQHPALRSKRILVADSDRDVRRSAHEILGRFGCIIETAHDGEEALRMTRTFHYDVVLADIRLPDLPGSKIYRSLKEIRPEMPVILTTVFGYDSGHAIVKARQAGMKRALFKPFRTDQLVSAIEEVL